VLDLDLGIEMEVGAGLRSETRDVERERTEGVVGREGFSM
jgi:hypothetical protein